MKLVTIDKIPEKRRGKKKLQLLLDNFVNANTADIVKVEFGESDYKNAGTCYSSMRIAVRRSGYRLKVAMRGNEVYLVKL